MPTIAQLEIHGRIIALLGGYVWDLGLFIDGVLHGGAGTCTPQHWSKRHSQHVKRFSLATRNELCGGMSPSRFRAEQPATGPWLMQLSFQPVPC